MNCRDNRDGSCTVEYLPTKPGDYDITIKFADRPIPGEFVTVQIKSFVCLNKRKQAGHEGWNTTLKVPLEIKLIQWQFKQESLRLSIATPSLCTAGCTGWPSTWFSTWTCSKPVHRLGTDKPKLFICCLMPSRQVFISCCFCPYLSRSMLTHQRSVAERDGCFQRRLFVSLSVCLFVNTIISERLNIGSWNMMVTCIVQKSRLNLVVRGQRSRSPETKKRKTAESSPLTVHSN